MRLLASISLGSAIGIWFSRLPWPFVRKNGSKKKLRTGRKETKQRDARSEYLCICTESFSGRSVTVNAHNRILSCQSVDLWTLFTEQLIDALRDVQAWHNQLTSSDNEDNVNMAGNHFFVQ